MSFRRIFALSGLGLLALGSSVAMADEAAAVAAAAVAHADPYRSLAAALAISVSVVGGAIGQGRTATAGLEAMGRNPGASDKIFTPMIIGLALIESLVLYAVAVVFIKM